MFKKIILFFIIFSLFIENSVEALSLDSFNSAGNQNIINFEVEMNPALPRPNQLVKIELNSYHFDINSAEIFYFLNKELIKSGIGKKSFIFQAPNNGTKTILTIMVKDIDKKVYHREIVIKPVETTLVYELKDAYKPVFYKGKAYILSNSDVSFKAFSDFVDEKGNYIDEDKLIYTWYVNYKVQQADSGYGKKTFHISRLDGFPRETRIEVQVTDLHKNNQSKAALILKPEESNVDFYTGIPAEPFRFKNIFKDGVLTISESVGDIIAVPYFMNGVNNIKKPVFFKWFLNNQKIIKSRADDMTIVKIANDSDNKTVNMSLEIENKIRPLQFYSGNFKVNFDSNNNNENFNSRKTTDNQSKNSNLKEDNNSFFGLF